MWEDRQGGCHASQKSASRFTRLAANSQEQNCFYVAGAGLPHPHGRKFSKLQFLRFQTALHDEHGDIWHTLYPRKAWMEERYGCGNDAQIFLKVIARGLDLVGIRKRK